MNSPLRKLVTLGVLLLGVYAAIRYLLPLFFPFLLGGILALAAEPIVRFLSGRLYLPRPAAAGIGVTMSFSFLAMVILLLAALVLRQLRMLTGILPDLETTIRGGMQTLSAKLLELASKAPGSVAPVLQRRIDFTYTDEFIEREARSKLGLIKEDEILFETND